MKKIILCLGIPVCLGSGCHKHGADSTAPVITLSAPINNQVYKNGDNVIITGTVTDNSLHELSINITSAGSGASLYSNVISVHNLTNYNISDNWKSTVTANTNAVVTVQAEDHDGNVAEQKTTVTINL